ncbi:MAG: hypothetical protein ACRDPY_06485 [Streptosporangiaceae bacterium]
MMHEPAPWSPQPAAAREDRRRAAPAVACAMCGIQLPAHQMVADGGQACADIRWYCRDARACTDRWTSRTARPGPMGAAQATQTPQPAQQEMPSPRMPAAWLGGAPDAD